MKRNKLFIIMVLVLVFALAMSVLLVGCDKDKKDKDEEEEKEVVDIWKGVDKTNSKEVLDNILTHVKAFNFTWTMETKRGAYSDMLIQKACREGFLVEQTGGDEYICEVLYKDKNGAFHYEKISKEAKYIKGPMTDSEFTKEVEDFKNGTYRTFELLGNEQWVYNEDNKTFDVAGIHGVIELTQGGMVVTQNMDGNTYITTIDNFGTTSLKPPKDSDCEVRPEAPLSIWNGIDTTDPVAVGNRFKELISGLIWTKQTYENGELNNVCHINLNSMHHYSIMNGKRWEEVYTIDKEDGSGRYLFMQNPQSGVWARGLVEGESVVEYNQHFVEDILMYNNFDGAVYDETTNSFNIGKTSTSAAVTITLQEDSVTFVCGTSTDVFSGFGTTIIELPKDFEDMGVVA